ncbi:MAG TPA: sulfurtransferase [Planctomycetia bacterium]|nr:sulfurtransferase [Planctomycetia bacterium]
MYLLVARAALFGVMLGAAIASPIEGYPQSQLLVAPEDLAAIKASPRPVVLDARPQAKYLAGHVPGARRVDAEAWAKSFKQGEDVKGWSDRIGELAITADSRVIIYDDNQSKDSARIWWILRYWGVESAAVLDGGWAGWTDAKLPVETVAAAWKPLEFKAVPRAERFASKQKIAASLKDRSLQIVDARSEKEHCGIELLRNKRSGSIPGAKHLEWSDLLDPKTRRFKPAAELKKIFADAGIDLDAPTAAHCQGGGRSAVMVFGMELLGAKSVANYHPSWAEWSADPEMPIAKPSPRK